MPTPPTSFRPKSREEQRVEHEFGAPLPDLLNRLYHEQGQSQADIARTWGVRVSTVSDWMAKYAIPTRDRRAVKAVLA